MRSRERGVRMRARRATAAVAIAGLSMPVLAGCESTQDKSAKIKREGVHKLAQAKGVRVTRESRDVKVLGTQTLHDANGTAVVVTMRNVSKRALSDLPVSVKLTGAGGKPLYANDAPGLETSLVYASHLEPGQQLQWINDQVTAAGAVAKASALVGDGKPAAGKAPPIQLTGARIETDPVSGIEARGKVRSPVEQRKLVIYAIAHRGAKVVAAGRAIIERLKAGKPAPFTIFFIGNPKGAQLTLSAPPTSLGA